MDIVKTKVESYSISTQLFEKEDIQEGAILVVGCSTSAVLGQPLGTSSSMECAASVYMGIQRTAMEYGLYIAAQCCEHLNRAIVIEREAVALELKLGIYREVAVVPHQHAGGAFATYLYSVLKDPVVIESIKADCGIDIGGTLIGMHLKEVAVPIKLGHPMIGEAHVTAARVRPKYIGGERAKYSVE